MVWMFFPYYLFGTTKKMQFRKHQPIRRLFKRIRADFVRLTVKEEDEGAAIEHEVGNI